MKPLNILISNDDGVFAAGIRALAKSPRPIPCNLWNSWGNRIVCNL